MTPRPRELAAILVTTALAAGGCANRHVVHIPVSSPPLAETRDARRLDLLPFVVEGVKTLDTATEVRRYLASELRARTSLAVHESAAADGGDGLVLRARGRYESSTAAVLGSGSLERTTIQPEPTAPDRRPRWAHGFSLVLDLELATARGDRIVWLHHWSSALPPRERTGALHGLYELLEPLADELVGVLAGTKTEERRVLLAP